MIQPITLKSIIKFQHERLMHEKEKLRLNETVIYAEKIILEILKEHEALIKNVGGNVVVTMSPERFKLIENIRPAGATLDDQSG